MVEVRRTRKRGSLSSDPTTKTYLRQWRVFKGFESQTDLAHASGITRATISRLESGKLQYRQYLLETLAITLGCTPAEILGVDPYDQFDLIRIYTGLSTFKKRALHREAEKIAGRSAK